MKSCPIIIPRILKSIVVHAAVVVALAVLAPSPRDFAAPATTRAATGPDSQTTTRPAGRTSTRVATTRGAATRTAATRATTRPSTRAAVRPVRGNGASDEEVEALAVDLVDGPPARRAAALEQFLTLMQQERTTYEQIDSLIRRLPSLDRRSLLTGPLWDRMTIEPAPANPDPPTGPASRRLARSLILSYQSRTREPADLDVFASLLAKTADWGVAQACVTVLEKDDGGRKLLIGMLDKPNLSKTATRVVVDKFEHLYSYPHDLLYRRDVRTSNYVLDSADRHPFGVAVRLLNFLNERLDQFMPKMGGSGDMRQPARTVPPAAGELKAMVDDPDPEVQRQATRVYFTLPSVRQTAAKPEMVQFLTDARPAVRQAAAVAFCDPTYHGRRTPQLFAALLELNDPRRDAWLVSWTQDPNYGTYINDIPTPALLKLLDTTEGLKRKAAAQVIAASPSHRSALDRPTLARVIRLAESSEVLTLDLHQSPISPQGVWKSYRDLPQPVAPSAAVASRVVNFPLGVVSWAGFILILLLLAGLFLRAFFAADTSPGRPQRDVELL